MEVWSTIPEYEGFYEVSNLGRIKSLDRMVNCSKGNSRRLWKGKLLKTNNKIGRGYIAVNLSKEGVIKVEYLHRLVAKAFIPNPENKPEVNHKDSNKLNNCATNLEWVTNTEHALYGYHIEGKSTPRKLDENSVREIRNLLNKGILQKEVAKRFGITQSAVSLIATNKTWKEENE